VRRQVRELRFGGVCSGTRAGGALQLSERVFSPLGHFFLREDIQPPAARDLQLLTASFLCHYEPRSRFLSHSHTHAHTLSLFHLLNCTAMHHSRIPDFTVCVLSPLEGLPSRHTSLHFRHSHAPRRPRRPAAPQACSPICAHRSVQTTAGAAAISFLFAQEDHLHLSRSRHACLSCPSRR